ncbi:MAG: family 10 glycosylhydrolase, partial [Lachnospiraceae bacterium]|nr:family 10 glycosylhydrolase [Lachnospiraceae bacterium]
MKKITKRIISVMLAVVLLLTTGNLGFSTKQAQAANNMRGVWLSFIDQQTYLRGKGQADYDASFRSICQTAASKGLNTIFVHVRSHNDAIYPSSIYPWSSQMLLGVDPGFDPLADMVAIAHESGLQIHAWINPYGYRNGVITGNAALATNDNIVAGVTEILDKYAVDGIHFDDYFPPVGAANISSMVSRVHQVSAAHGKVFGIAPQGNIQNVMASGADVATWLSTPGYIDYIAPQIYWTDNYGAAGTTTMSSDKLAAWKSLNKAGITMYVGMAL